nr:MAG TPA_asm: hypothetical protein [Bacteriophage sp.]
MQKVDSGISWNTMEIYNSINRRKKNTKTH